MDLEGLYVNYSALTSCWIPGFPRLLENVAFQRELDDNAPEEEGDDLLEQEESEVEDPFGFFHPLGELIARKVTCQDSLETMLLRLRRLTKKTTSYQHGKECPKVAPFGTGNFRRSSEIVLASLAQAELEA